MRVSFRTRINWYTLFADHSFDLTPNLAIWNLVTQCFEDVWINCAGQIHSCAYGRILLWVPGVIKNNMDQLVKMRGGKRTLLRPTPPPPTPAPQVTGKAMKCMVHMTGKNCRLPHRWNIDRSPSRFVFILRFRNFTVVLKQHNFANFPVKRS